MKIISAPLFCLFLPMILYAQFTSSSGLDLTNLSSLKMQQNALGEVKGVEREGIPAPVNDTFYRIGPGDVIKISYMGSIAEEELSLTVDPEGKLFIPKMGAVSTSRPFLDLKKEISALIRSKTKNLDIVIQLEGLKALNSDISGAITFPGNYSLAGASRLNDLFRKSCTNELGTFSMPTRSDLRNVKIRRSDGIEENVDLRDYLQNGTVSGNPYLYCGDRVHVPFWSTTVSVSGAVQKSHTCEWRDEDLFHLIEFSGGLAPHADSTIRVNRFKSNRQGVETFQLKYPDQCHDFKILPEDNVIAGANPLWRNGINTAINGRVKNPGVYTLPRSAKAADLIKIAGGLLADADSLTVYLQRPQVLNNQSNQTLQENLTGFSTQTAITLSTKGSILSLADQIQLQDGDIVSVPLQTNTVSVIGKVRRPGMVEYTPGRNWKRYVKNAGGFDDNAYNKYAKVYKKRNNSWVFADNVESIEPGDIILIPETPQEYGWNKFKDVVAVTSGILSITATIIILGNQ